MHLYTDIFKRAFFITWKNKFLWFFGFFATIFSGIEVYEVLLNKKQGFESFGVLMTWMRLKELGFFTARFWVNFLQFAQNEPVTFVVLVLIVFIFIAILSFIIWLAVVSQVGIIENSHNLELKKKADIQTGVESGINNFWSVLGLNLFVKLSSFLVLFIFGLFFLKMSISFSWNIGYSFLYIFSFIFAVPFIAVVFIVVRYAINYIVLDGKKIKDAFFSAIQLFLKNWLASVEMLLGLVAIGLVYSGLVFSVLSVVAVPVLFVVDLCVQAFGVVSIWLIVIVTILMSILVSVAIAFFISFQITTWTLFYLKINSGEGVVSKIVRLTQRS